MADDREFIISFKDRAQLEAQLPTLEAGGAFAVGVTDISELQLCTAVLVHPESGARLELGAMVVWIADNGVGLQFRDFDAAVLNVVRAFIAQDAKQSEVPASQERSSPRNLHLEVRKLSASQRQQLARDGGRPERAALERAFGKGVWESLLRNPKITKPEVAGIAQKGALPRALLETIVDSSAWLTSPQIRRTLLSNRSLTRQMIGIVLRATPSTELKLVPKQTAYPLMVRDAATKMLK